MLPSRGQYGACLWCHKTCTSMSASWLWAIWRMLVVEATIKRVFPRQTKPTVLLLPPHPSLLLKAMSHRHLPPERCHCNVRAPLIPKLVSVVIPNKVCVMLSVFCPLSHSCRAMQHTCKPRHGKAFELKQTARRVPIEFPKSQLSQSRFPNQTGSLCTNVQSMSFGY